MSRQPRSRICRQLMAVTLLLSTLGLTGCYSIRQAVHHNNLINGRRPVADVVADPKTAQDAREALLWIEDVKVFAATQGLNIERSYRYYIPLDRSVVTYLVQAAHWDKLESVTWWFPFVGRVPYLGFFEEAERDEKADELAADGHDVHRGGASAFSSLGWFEDPIFEPMIRRSKDRLAHLFFHELTHRTFWAPSSVRFNENLAEYIGRLVTERFLEARKETELLKRYRETFADRALYKAWLTKLKAELKELYASPPSGGKKALLDAKAAVFKRYTTSEKPAFKVVNFVGKRPWNNARVLASSLYQPDFEPFEAAMRCLGDVTAGEYLEQLDDAFDDHDDPFDALKAMCSREKAS